MNNRAVERTLGKMWDLLLVLWVLLCAGLVVLSIEFYYGSPHVRSLLLIGTIAAIVANAIETGVQIQKGTSRVNTADKATWLVSTGFALNLLAIVVLVGSVSDSSFC